ncbi:AAA family ATPase [Leptolyngbya sp. NIES-2104]|uniref:AAA family ATPase n=1 Tax=Leptolyngbya sp. NIES-2104 TaxID=1552121 RepID=UPI0006ECC451|nr:AAA family ATPase [Leptolyngbya sp. NIES-2104]GAP98166.1 ribulose 1,5-bisphosphate carboxylase/oxygenase activase [Leptolyngbya sp. NIES-2104]
MSYYISPRFLDKLSVHITKNFLLLPNVKAPLILGVHGRKGEGKSFQCDLVFERMGIEAVYMSAGELESPDAGDPARLIRLRYREAAEYVKVRGKMSVLLINDFDAGAGRVDQFTQYTVNTQLVHGTLMNIADNPTNVQLPGSYDSEPIQRIPIILTGNDFSTLYAPLTRDGRMDKFFWEPDRADRIGIVGGIFEIDQVPKSDIEKLVDQFPNQAIDFFGALRSRLYDEQIRRFINDVGIDRISQRVVNSTEAPPEFRRPDFSLSHLIEVGTAIGQEQKRLQELRLVEEYNQTVRNRGLGEIKRNPQPVQNSAMVSEPVRSPAVPASSSYNGQPSSTRLTPEIVSEVNQILRQGQRLGIEVVDARRFRTNSWNCYGMFEGDGAAAISALETCLDENQKNYVRIVGIRDRQRVIELIVHRPNQ